MAFNEQGLNSYVDVAQRIADFRELHPTGCLQPLHLDEPWTVTSLKGIAKDGKEVEATFIVYTAAAYRTPEDPRPGIGCAYEVFPGRTPYTAGSELQNAETAAWGRAIVAALASDSKAGVASREEVRNRAAERDAPLEVDEHGAMTFAEQVRTVTGAVDGVERLTGTPDDDPWLSVDGNGERRPPGQLPKPIGPQPPRGGMQERLQPIAAVQIHFKRLGVVDKAYRLFVTALFAGLEPGSLKTSNDLTEQQAKQVADELSHLKDGAALAARKKAIEAERELAAAEPA